MEFQQFLYSIKDAANVRRWIPGDLLNGSVGQKIEIQFRAHVFQDLRQMQCRHFRAFAPVRGLDQCSQYRRIMP